MTCLCESMMSPLSIYVYINRSDFFDRKSFPINSNKIPTLLQHMTLNKYRLKRLTLTRVNTSCEETAGFDRFLRTIRYLWLDYQRGLLLVLTGTYAAVDMNMYIWMMPGFMFGIELFCAVLSGEEFYTKYESVC